MQRLEGNPLLSPADLAPTRDDLEVFCTLNPAAARFGDEIILLVRVGERPVETDEACQSTCVWDHQAGEVAVRRFRRDDPDFQAMDLRAMQYRGKVLLTSLSHLRVARSSDGGKTFTFDDKPAIFPASPYEAFGCEDARITFINGQYYITYTAVSDRGVAVAMAYTRDFRTFTRAGLIFPPAQKDVAIFPEKVRGLYVCRHRPAGTEFNYPCIWTAWSPDLQCWGHHSMTLAPKYAWEADRVGAGAPPIKTPEGWLEIYHAADANGRYSLGAMLSDLEHPERVIARSPKPVLEPEAPYELAGVYGNCVFSNGLAVNPDGGLIVYYGAADSICAGALTSVDEMIRAARGR